MSQVFRSVVEGLLLFPYRQKGTGVRVTVAGRGLRLQTLKGTHPQEVS